MSILQNLKWALPISNDYRVWWQTWSGNQISFDSYSTRSKFGEEIMKILDTDAESYRDMIEIGSIYAMSQRKKNIPYQYSLDRCKVIAQQLINDISKRFDYVHDINIQFDYNGTTTNMISSNLKIKFKTCQTDAKECVLQIVPKTCRLKEITDIIPIYKQLENEPGYYCESELIVRQN